MQFLDYIAHQIHIMGSSGTVVPYGTCHTVGERLVDHCHWKHSLLPFIDIPVFLHYAPAVEAVYNGI